MRNLTNRGGGKFLKGNKSLKYCRCLVDWILHNTGLRSLINSRYGAIIIELAFSIPIFLYLIYYLHDIPKMQRYYNQMQFVSQQMAQMLQTISQGRSNKQITQKDIALVVRAAYLSAYPGTSAFTKRDDKGPFAGPGFPHGQLFYIKCENNGKASIKWMAKFQGGGNNTITPANPIAVSQNSGPSNIDYSQNNVDPSVIYSGLKMNPGETRVIVESGIWAEYGHGGYQIVGGGTWRDVTPRQGFGLLMADPNIARVLPWWYFGRTTVFAPRAGLFTDNFPS